GLEIEPVAGLRLEGGRAGMQHPPPVLLHQPGEGLLARRSGRPNRRHDPPARAMELFVRSTSRPQGELLDAVTCEAGMRVAVDEPRDRAEPPTVQLLDLAGERRKRAHRANRFDGVPVTE